jgi:SAM-dependent methyltransferase
MLQRFYPEVEAGGFSRVDGTIEFYTRVNALLAPEMTVLDFGAGRGAALKDDRCAYRRDLRRLKGKVGKVIGIDVDPVVRENSGLDKAHVIEPGAPLPLSDGSVDLVVADYVFEHIPDPETTACELDRVLRPGGWICARTPNRWGYVAVAASLIPERLHAAVLRRVQPGRKSEDVFPTVYRMNDRGTLRRLFPPLGFLDLSDAYSAEPSYMPHRAFLWRASMLFEAFCPEALKSNLFVFLRKRSVQ